MKLFKRKRKKKNPNSAIRFYGIWLFLGILLFWLGFHNMDQCQNFMRLQCGTNKLFLEHGFDTNVSYHESNQFFSNVSLVTCYKLGVTELLFSLVMIVIGGVNFGFQLRGLMKK